MRTKCTAVGVIQPAVENSKKEDMVEGLEFLLQGHIICRTLRSGGVAASTELRPCGLNKLASDDNVGAHREASGCWDQALPASLISGQQVQVAVLNWWKRNTKGQTLNPKLQTQVCKVISESPCSQLQLHFGWYLYKQPHGNAC